MKKIEVSALWQKVINMLLLPLFLLLLFVAPCSICTAEEHPEIQPAVQELQIRLTRVQNNNEMLAQNLRDSNEALAIANEQLTLLNNQVIELKTQLASQQQSTERALSSSKTAESSLKLANQYFEDYRQENKKEISKLKAEAKMYKFGLIAYGLYKGFS